MLSKKTDPSLDLEKAEVILAVQIYLRQARQLRLAGEPPLTAQPHWVEAALWSHACRAARRLAAWPGRHP